MGRPPLRTGWALALLLLGGCAGEAGDLLEQRRPALEEAPNVILISLDTLRPDHMGVYGYERNTTPFLDELAAESLVFDLARTTWTWTLIAHMSMLTGLYPAQHQVWSDTARLAEGTWTLAARLAEEGYETWGFYHTPAWLEPSFGFEQGFDRYVPHRSVGQAMDHVEEALVEKSADRPLFLFLHLFDIHNAPFTDVGPLYMPPREYADRFLLGAWDKASENDLDRPKTKQRIWESADVPVSAEQRDAIEALYDACIAHVDDRLRELFASFERRGLMENTLVVVTSDHGEGLAERWKKFGGHGGAFEEGMRVPLIVQLPKAVRRSGRVAQPASHTDIAPTVLDLCGIAADDRLLGSSLLGELPDERAFFAQHEDRRVVYRLPWKVMELQKGRPSIYNLEEDPGELRRGLTAKQKRQRTDLARRILEWADEERTTWFTPGAQAVQDLSADHAANMQALGYGGGSED
jgi:arylsulfatase A-like enzyme